MAADDGKAKKGRRYQGVVLRLIDESVSLFHQLRGLAERVHHEGRLTAGKRGILRGIDLLGPQTVPQMARARNVTRQHIQAMVNELMAEGLTELAHNPAHKRSKLVQLTAAGRRHLDEITKREEVLLATLDFGLREEELRQAADVLRRISKALVRLDPTLNIPHADLSD